MTAGIAFCYPLQGRISFLKLIGCDRGKDLSDAKGIILDFKSGTWWTYIWFIKLLYVAVFRNPILQKSYTMKFEFDEASMPSGPYQKVSVISFLVPLVTALIGSWGYLEKHFCLVGCELGGCSHRIIPEELLWFLCLLISEYRITQSLAQLRKYIYPYIYLQSWERKIILLWVSVSGSILFKLKYY